MGTLSYSLDIFEMGSKVLVRDEHAVEEKYKRVSLPHLMLAVIMSLAGD